MRIGPIGSLDGPISGFRKLAETQQRYAACAEHAEEQRIERAKLARIVRRRNGCARIAGLRTNKCECVVAQGEVRTQLDGSLQLDQGLVRPVAQPKRPTHGPVCGWVAIIDNEASSCGFESAVDLRFALRPALERVL